MHARKPLTALSSWGLNRDFDIFFPEDVPHLVYETFPDLQSSEREWPEILSDLNHAALTFLHSRLFISERLAAGENAKRLRQVAKRARELNVILGDGWDDLLPSDIGFAPPVLEASGLDPATIKEDFFRIRDSARAARRVLVYDLPELLSLLIIAAEWSATQEEGRRGSGRNADFARHDFVCAVASVYQRAFERPGLTTSRSTDTGERGGPASRFLATVCNTVVQRLLPEEWKLQPALVHELNKAADLQVAATWIEAARNIQEKSAKI